MELESVFRIVTSLRNYVEREDFKGYDPYDLLASKWNLQRLGPKVCFYLTQIHKRNPFNIRPLLQIPKQDVPKGIALFLEAYCKLYKLTKDENLVPTMHKLHERLMVNRSPGYALACWGLNYDYSSRLKFSKSKHPSVVVTSYAQRALMEYFDIFPSERTREVILSCGEYVLNQLPRTETEEGICFSYTDIEKDVCYNANAHGFEILSRCYSLSKDERYKELARKSVDFTLNAQHDDGHWNYRMLKSGIEKVQIDFHQGFILESLEVYMSHCNDARTEIKESIAKGLDFYRTQQFLESGRALWRLPLKWPSDIHCQTQGIITFSKLKIYDSSYLNFAGQILSWTLENMRSQSGGFYYRKNRLWTNKIHFIRWGQAWMLLALVEYLKASRLTSSEESIQTKP